MIGLADTTPDVPVSYEDLRDALLDGEDGVEAVVSNFLTDFDLTMGLCGCANFDELDRNLLVTVD